METRTRASKVIYTGKTHTIGGRGHGVSRSSDGHLYIKLSTPGADDIGTNPEQLLGAGWSACFEGAMEIVASRTGINLPNDTAVDAEIDLCFEKGDYYLQARLNISIPGVENEIAQQLVSASRKVCPYTKVLEQNMNVQFNLN